VNWQCGYLLASQKLVHGLASLLLSCLFLLQWKTFLRYIYVVKTVQKLAKYLLLNLIFFSVGKPPNTHIWEGHSPSPNLTPSIVPTLLHPWTLLFPQSLGSSNTAPHHIPRSTDRKKTEKTTSTKNCPLTMSSPHPLGLPLTDQNHISDLFRMQAHLSNICFTVLHQIYWLPYSLHHDPVRLRPSHVTSRHSQPIEYIRNDRSRSFKVDDFGTMKASIIGVGARATLAGGDKTFLPENICMKN